jgi:hypothetical protein
MKNELVREDWIAFGDAAKSKPTPSPSTIQPQL